MASELLVNKITPESGTTLTLGESGDTITLVTSTIDVTVADGRIGIGIVPSGARLEVSNGDSGVTPVGDVFFEDDADFTVVIATPNDGIGNINFSDPDASGQGKIRYNHSDDSMRFEANSSEAIRIDSSGHAIIPNGVTLGTTVGTYNAANTIDDYEEGTWTPTYEPASGSFTSITYDSQAAEYVKIGRLVYVTGRLRTDAITVGTASGTVRISGLPFTTDGTNFRGVTTIYGSSWGTNRPNFVLTLASATQLALYRHNEPNDVATVTVTDMATGANSNNIYFNCVYQIAG